MAPCVLKGLIVGHLALPSGPAEFLGEHDDKDHGDHNDGEDVDFAFAFGAFGSREFTTHRTGDGYHAVLEACVKIPLFESGSNNIVEDLSGQYIREDTFQTVADLDT